MKRLFQITEPYQFEWNDIRAFITLLNVILIMVFGLSVSWFGLAVATLGLIKDLTIDRRINGTLMHLSNIVLNLYFISLL